MISTIAKSTVSTCSQCVHYDRGICNLKASAGWGDSSKTFAERKACHFATILPVSIEQQIKQKLIANGFTGASVVKRWNFSYYQYSVYVRNLRNRRSTLIATGKETEIIKLTEQWIDAHSSKPAFIETLLTA
jgi:hypothetical protein